MRIPTRLLFTAVFALSVGTLAGCSSGSAANPEAQAEAQADLETFQALRALCADGATRETILDEATARGWDDEKTEGWGVNETFFADCEVESEPEVTGLTYPSIWNVAEVPNAAAGSAAYRIRYDGVLIQSEFVVPDVTEADADAWIAAVAEDLGAEITGNAQSVKGSGMVASYQLNSDGSTLFRYYHGWNLPMGDGNTPIPLPAEWNALPLPEGATYQNAWAAFNYNPGGSVNWDHPAYFFTFTDDTVDAQGMYDRWSAAIDKEEYFISAGGGGSSGGFGISLQPAQTTDTSDLPSFGP